MVDRRYRKRLRSGGFDFVMRVPRLETGSESGSVKMDDLQVLQIGNCKSMLTFYEDL
jgi:hypothetical protein